MVFLKPDWAAITLADVSVETLMAEGLKGALIDLDNTLMIPRTPTVPESIQTWLASAKANNFKCAVVSNNKKPAYIEQAGQILQIPVIAPAYKPGRKGLQAGLDAIGLLAHEVVVVGDRPLTDILGGKRIGAKTIWVKNLTYQSDSRGVQVLRFLESLVIRH